MLLGLSIRPHADVLFDNATLYSRWGFILAHELGHLNMGLMGIGSIPYFYNIDRNTENNVYTAMYRYPCTYDVVGLTIPGTNNEAWADFMGTLCILKSGVVPTEQFCAHQSQQWCARMAPGYPGACNPLVSHPSVDLRGNNICERARVWFPQSESGSG